MTSRNWVARLSGKGAVALAAAWPLATALFALITLVATKAINVWNAARTNDSVTYFVRYHVASWGGLAFILLGPSVAFLCVWWFVRQRSRTSAT